MKIENVLNGRPQAASCLPVESAELTKNRSDKIFNFNENQQSISNENPLNKSIRFIIELQDSKKEIIPPIQYPLDSQHKETRKTHQKIISGRSINEKVMNCEFFYSIKMVKSTE